VFPSAELVCLFISQKCYSYALFCQQKIDEGDTWVSNEGGEERVR